jgi:hypothetical protein
MRVLLALILTLFVGGAEARFPRGQALTQISCNLVTGVASVGGPCTSTTTCNNTGDDAPAFKAFNTWARANQGSSQVVLTIPNGSNCVFNSGQTYSGVVTTNTFAAGINNLIVEFTGATLSEGTGGFRLGGGGVCYIGIASVGGCSARIQTVSAGSSTVTLTAASSGSGYISRFSVGNWIMIGGLDPQGQYLVASGDPPNNHWFEWRQIVSCNAAPTICTGTTITLDRPLSNSYLSTWPLYNAGDNFHSDNGGPATIWKMNDTWNASAEYRGGTFAQSSLTYGELRNLTYRNVTFTGAFGACPTQNETWAAYGMTSTSADMEVDKLIGTMIMDNVTIFKIAFQSSSIDRLIMTNSSVQQLTGTPKRVDITDTAITTSWQLGARAYGVSYGPITCTRCAVASFDFNAGLFQNTPSDYSMSSGLITYANTSVTGSGPTSRIFVPNTNIFQTASGFLTLGLFKTQTVTQDPTNSFAQTSEAAGFPMGAGTAQFRTGVIPQFTCDTCTGDATLVAAGVQAGATPATPLAQYSFRSFAPTSAQGALGDLIARGRIASLTIDVTQAYTGSGAAVLHATAQFDNLVTVKQSNWTTFSWGPQINLKQTGTRVITPSGVTCNAVAAPTGCSGDSLGTALPEAVWIQDKISPYMGSTLSGGVNPLFTMTLRTDQGIVP